MIAKLDTLEGKELTKAFCNERTHIKDYQYSNGNIVSAYYSACIFGTYVYTKEHKHLAFQHARQRDSQQSILF